MDIDNYYRDCPLCRLTNDGETLTDLHHEDDILTVVDCLVCRVPMAVLKAHRAGFSSDEQDHVRSVFRSLSPHGGTIDWEQRQIPDHAHCHLRPHPFPGTSHWEQLLPDSE